MGAAKERRMRMKAIVCPKYGPAEVLRIEEREAPAPRDDEILIKVYAASVTNSDLFIRSGKVDPALVLPFRLMIGIRRPRHEIIGEVFAGTVEAVGSSIGRFRVGDRVYGLTGMSLGAYADYMCMGERDSKRGCVARMPEALGFEDATGVAYGGLLALQALEKGGIAGRKSALVYGASGTTGTMAVQIARAFGAEATAVCGAAKAEFVRSLGATAVLDYADDASIGKLGRYDLVLDAVGKARTSRLKEACRRALAPGGAYVSIDGEALACDSARLERVGRLVAEKGLRPVTDRVFEFSQVVEAHEYVELGHKLGNVAIRVNA
jgi:NADPH:quinone reductase-like Zn-dependent oxidoreductase